MSSVSPVRRFTVRDIAGRKGKTPIVSLTAYTAPTARAVDPHCDFVLVGDSLGMVLYGMDTTVTVTLDMMIAHGKAVVCSTRRSLVVIDMPFGSYEESPEVAFRNAARIMAETGCTAVKLEGGTEMATTIRFLVDRGIPVLAHIGLMPQSVNAAGGFRVQGRSEAGAGKVRADAVAGCEAGAFAVVIENTVEALARELTDELPVPTIGIGASPACDGQILVTEDIVGSGTEFTPRFVKRYASLGDELANAVAAYADDVRERRFPAPEHCFEESAMKDAPSRIASLADQSVAVQ